MFLGGFIGIHEELAEYPPFLINTAQRIFSFLFHTPYFRRFFLDKEGALLYDSHVIHIRKHFKENQNERT